jgi:hypothetical protein
MRVKFAFIAALCAFLPQAVSAAAPADGSVLPFPPVPSASVAKPRLQDSMHKRRAQPQHLKPGAPNVLIILLDDVGFGQASTFGGEMNTPTLSRLATQGVSYNAFHTTAICSPTRAALLTGRNHQRVGNGTIAERAVDWDGYTGVIPKTSATMAEVLRHYGYKTAAFGKWHNTPADQTTAMGPFDRWPTGHGFDYFYGFLAGETSQWEPRLVENLTAVEPPHDEKYHLSEDLAERGITWLRKHRAFSPDNLSSCTGRRARRTGRTRSPRPGPTNTRASSTTAGTPTASACSRARRSSAGSRPTPGSLRAPHRCRRGKAFLKRSGRSSAG